MPGAGGFELDSARPRLLAALPRLRLLHGIAPAGPSLHYGDLSGAWRCVAGRIGAQHVEGIDPAVAGRRSLRAQLQAQRTGPDDVAGGVAIAESVVGLVAADVGQRADRRLARVVSRLHGD